MFHHFGHGGSPIAAIVLILVVILVVGLLTEGRK